MQCGGSRFVPRCRSRLARALQAFEHVDRRLPLEEAVALGYPPSALMAALDMYAMKRPLVFRGCVGTEMRAPRGHRGR